MTASLATATGKLVDVLTPLSTEERARVVSAALTLLGDTLLAHQQVGGAAAGGVASGGQSIADTNESNEDIPQSAALWMRRNGVDRAQIEATFHFDQGKVTVLQLPTSAKSVRAKVVGVYLFVGLSALFEKGEASFTDDSARKLCEHFGCFDATNHGKALQTLGNKITGSKSNGWKLTSPGLTEAADLLKAAVK